MLGSCINLNTRSESSIRHKVRKLRAKVRALIPSDTCVHFKKRNEQVQKNTLKRNICLHNSLHKSNQTTTLQTQISKQSSASLWKFGTSKIQQWHFSTGHADQNGGQFSNYEFQKLKPWQIQQINEDKIYYLGEKNVNAFNNYLKTLKSKNYLEDSPQNERKTVKFQQPKKLVESVSIWESQRKIVQNCSGVNISKQTQKARFTYNFGDSVCMSSMHNLNGLNHNRSSAIGLSKWNTEVKIPTYESRNTINDQKLRKVKNVKKDSIINLKSLEQRKEELEEDDKQKRIYQKLKIQMQMAKADANQKEMKYKQYSKIKQMQDQQKERHDRAVKRKSVLMKKGQIVKCSEELRNIMLRRRNIQHTARSASCIFQETLSTY